jgi:hypothetical protein
MDSSLLVRLIDRIGNHPFVCGKAVIRNFAPAYGTRVIFSSGSLLVTGLRGTGVATPSSARHFWHFLRSQLESYRCQGRPQRDGFVPTMDEAVAQTFSEI